MQRKIESIDYSWTFLKKISRLAKRVSDDAEQKATLFKEDAFHPRLHTHKLHGKYKNYWSFTIVGQYRIMFTFNNKNFIDFVDVGTHEIYK